MPGTQTLTLSNEQLATQLAKLLADYRRLKKYNTPVTDAFLRNAETWDGSDSILIPWEDTDHSTPTALVSGYERWNDAVSTTMTAGRMTPAWVVQPIMIAEIDELMNSGPREVINRLKKNTTNVQDHFSRNVQKVVMRGPSSSGSYVAPPSFTSWNTFNGVDFPTGFFQHVAQGGNTIHGVAQAGYAFATFPRFSNLTFDVASAAGTNLATMMFQACVQLSVNDQWPTAAECIWYCSVLLLTNLKKFMRTFEQYIDSGKGTLDDGKRMPIGPGGVPMQPIADMPLDGAQTGAAGGKMSGLLTNWKRGTKPFLFNGWKMDTTGFSDIPGTAGVKAALMKLGGNLSCQEPGLQVTLKNAEVY